MNFAQMANLIYQNLKYPDTNRLSIALLKEYLDEAERSINKQTRIIRGSSIVDVVAGQATYALPTDILNWQIDDIYYSTSDSTERRRLIPTTIRNLDQVNSGWRENEGQPTCWYVDKEAGVYGFAPYESIVSDGANCIEVMYRAKHTKMTHYYVTGTVDVINANTAITGNSTAFIGNVSANDELGIGKLLDASRLIDFPTTFFPISADPAANDALILSSVYAGATASAQNYIISSPSSILNDELNMCAVLIVMGLAKGKEGDFKAKSALMAEAMARINAEKATWLNDANINEAMVPYGHAPYPGSGCGDYNFRG